MTTYTVAITRERELLLADVPELPGTPTFARTPPSLVQAAKEVIILMDDLPDDSTVRVQLFFLPSAMTDA